MRRWRCTATGLESNLKFRGKGVLSSGRFRGLRFNANATDTSNFYLSTRHRSSGEVDKVEFGVHLVRLLGRLQVRVHEINSGHVSRGGELCGGIREGKMQAPAS